MRSSLLALLVGLAGSGAAAVEKTPPFPDSTAADRTSVAVTVYNQNLALVRETRTLELDRAGTGTLRFMDVPSQINPRTVHVQPLAQGGPAVLEQNYEYDLISPDKLMEKYVGRDVEIVEQAQDLTTRTVQAKLLSTNGGPVYRIGDRIVLGQAGRVTLPDVPADLVARPTLVWTLDAGKSGRAPAEVSYLTDGMNWSADYVAVVDADDRRAGLSGWVTVDNHSGASFADATLKLVAGDVRRVTPQALMQYEAKAAMGRAAAAPQFQEESFFEYHLYTLDRPTTVKDNQTKQLSLFSAPSVPVTKKLLLTGDTGYFRNNFGTGSQNQKVAVVLEIKNEQAGGLGMPLPKGTVRVYKKDKSGAEQFVGEDSIDHTPKDEMVRLHVGDAFDVVAERSQTDYKAVSPRQVETAWTISLRNRKDEDVAVTVREPVGGDWTLLSSSLPGKKVDQQTLEFEVPVPKGKEVKLSYRLGVRW
ncbi:MAG TPA: DUF4139 domain-containing protein [Candidatus Sulfotelmatobacter sp.]|jgi:hypothetical protein|nr:DUF4139 domain-containing protein [Candidatus Sulfotelmatobacter sp.]